MQLYSLPSNLVFLFAIKYNLCSCSSYPNHHPFLEAESHPPHGHQVPAAGELSQPQPQQHLLWDWCPHPSWGSQILPQLPAFSPEAALGLSWTSPQGFQDLVQPSSTEFMLVLVLTPLFPGIPMKVGFMDRAIIRVLCGHKD